TGLCRPQVYLSVTNSALGFTKSYYVQIHSTPLTAVRYDSEQDPATLTDFAILKKPLYKDSIDNVVAISPDYLKPLNYNPTTGNLTIGGFISAAPLAFNVEYYHAEDKTYNLSYWVPREDALEPGFSAPPPECADWVEMPESVIVPAFVTKAVPIKVTVPPNVILEPTRFEFWVVVREAEATEGVMMVEGTLKGVTQKTQYIQQWLVSLE
ncbi:hypothetical protein, partial [Candidatus Magnetobacterium casense]